MSGWQAGAAGHEPEPRAGSRFCVVHGWYSAPVCPECEENRRRRKNEAIADRAGLQHGPDEIYSKFEVYKKRDGEKLPDEEFVFVLRPERDMAARAALAAYARACFGRGYRNLAKEIDEKLVELGMERDAPD